MADNNYFQKALSNFTTAVAYKDAVKHLYDLGYSAQSIKKQIGYPVSLDKIQKVIEDYEAMKNSPESNYEFVQETDRFGHKSFRKIQKIDSLNEHPSN